MKPAASFWGILGIIAIALLGRYLTGSDSFLKLLYFAGGLLVLGFFWSLLSLRGVKIKRSARELRQQYGQVFEERYEITNQSTIIRPWIEVLDQSDLPSKVGSRVISWLGRREQRSYSTYAFLSERGIFSLGPTVLRSGDPFGLFSCQRKFESQQSLLVLPYFVDLDRFLYPSGLMPGGKAQQHRTTEVTPHASGVREYSPGDALNRIHWASSAKRQKMMVKEFDRDPQSDLWIFLDAQRHIHLRMPYTPPEQSSDQLFFLKRPQHVELPPDTFEYTISVCASICRYFIKVGQAVGLNANNKNLLAIQPERGERQLDKIIEALAYIKADGSQDFQALIESHKGHIPRGSSIVIITPSVQEGLVRGINALTMRDMFPVVVLMDRITFGGDDNHEKVMMLLQSSNIPAAVVSRTNDLKTAIEAGFRYIPISNSRTATRSLHAKDWQAG